VGDRKIRVGLTIGIQFLTCFRSALWLTPDTYHVATEGSIPESKATGREAHRSPASGVEVKSAWSNSVVPPALLSDMVLKGKGAYIYGYNIRYNGNPRRKYWSV
jgi:hypothetical protein